MFTGGGEEFHARFMLFQLGPLDSDNPEELAEFVNLMRQMERWGSFGENLVATQGNPADPHYVLAALRNKDYRDWLDGNKQKKNQYWWAKHFAQLEEYVAEEGSADLRWINTTTRARFELGLWCMHQRRMYHARKLSTEQAKRLEALPGWDWGPGHCEW